MKELTHIDVYDNWIRTNAKDMTETPESVTLRMQQAFPELRRIYGLHSNPARSGRPHWWLEWCGLIIDPTSGQFAYPGHFYSKGKEVKP